MTTLRNALIKTLPDLSVPENLENPDYDETKGYDPNNPRYIDNLDSGHKLMRQLITDAAAYTARVYSESLGYISDSTIDSHNAMISTMTELHRLIYGDDQTLDDQQALDQWLDNETNLMDLAEVSNPNTGPSDGQLTPPALFDYFNLSDDFLYPDDEN